jgi:hypothetical protein
MVAMTASTKASMTARRTALLVACLLLAACTTTTEKQDGICTADPTITTDCNGTADGGAPQNLGLTGYSCTGTARPDQGAVYIEGVPQGIICANQIPPTDGGAPASPQNYCCTNATTPCAYDPVAACDPGTYAYQCLDINRPESYNPTIRCGQGVRATNYVDYCCSGTGLPAGCGEQDGLAGCVPGLVGWQCPITGTQHTLPKGQDLMSNKSRADQYYLLCSIPQVAPSGKVDTFCCYPPASVPPGGSCLEDVYVSNCNPLTQFGFACTGPETPEADYPPIVCPNPGTRGTSMEGYPATLFCCNFVNDSH